jgi:nitrate/TMAO reductase-like tetraheme cytochrome c subunit
MDTAAFCGSCHAVMQPEVDAWSRSPHSSVSCATCHIGTGATGFVKAKWNGVRQLYEYVTGTFPLPAVQTAGHMLPARETCEQCHAPDRFFPDRIKVFPHYGLDKDNTPKFNALLLRVGGRNPATGRFEGIHAHADPDKQVEYEYLDPRRREIGNITVRAGGKVKAVYQRTGGPGKPLGVRSMDCVDCHNRATHVFAEGPARAIDRALYAGALDPKLPFVAQVARELLAGTDVPREQAAAHFQAALAAAYKTQHPEVKVDPAALTDAGATLARIYLGSIYPAERLGWNQHPSNAGHRAEGLKDPGCFRCHNGDHETTLADGRRKKLGQDCDACHTGLAFDQDPGKFDDTLASLLPASR